MIRVLITDGDGTLGLPDPSAEIHELVAALEDMGIELAIASNASSTQIRQRFLRSGLPIPRVVVTQYDVGVKKPSQEFVHEIVRQTGVELHELAFLGDDDRTDIFCAVNAGVLPLAASYSTAGKPLDYGLQISSPRNLCRYLETFGSQEPPYFGWSASSTCPNTNTEVNVHALIGQHREMGLTNVLKRVLKDHQIVSIGTAGITLNWLLFHYLITQCYLSGFMPEIDYVTVYPGHKVDSLNPTLSEFLAFPRRMFRQKFIPDLLIRHTDAPSQHIEKRSIVSQFSTLQVNPAYRRRLSGKKGKNILVLDDFTTSGGSLEAARHFLLRAGAANVHCLAMAKYRTNQILVKVLKDWDPFVPTPFSTNDLDVTSVSGSFTTADEYFKENIFDTYQKS